ncbi:MAG: type II toxin-antitoxin system PemK/MazF family toxin [Patescibacteria group bacterium]
MKYKRDFNKWNIEKQRIDTSSKNKKIWFAEKDIWWSTLGVNIGVEIDGKNEKFGRPVLIIKVFNREGLYILPITSKDKLNKFYYLLYDFKEKESSFNSVVLTQLKFISSKRLLRKIGKISEKDFLKIKEKLKEFI